MMEKSYVDTVRLLLESAPVLFQTPHFAMKGGTAINLFLQNMPRLSVDSLNEKRCWFNWCCFL